MLFAVGPVCCGLSWWPQVSPTVSSEGQSVVSYYKTVYYPTYNHLEGLLVGVLISIVQTFRPVLWEKLMKQSRAFLCAGTILLIFAMMTCSRGKTRSLAMAMWGFPLFSAAYGSFVLVSLFSYGIWPRRRSPFFSWLSTLAYCTYLTHKPVIKFVHLGMQQLAFGNFSLATPAVTVLVLFAVANLLHWAVEAPFLHFRDHLL